MVTVIFTCKYVRDTKINKSFIAVLAITFLGHFGFVVARRNVFGIYSHIPGVFSFIE